MMKTTLQNAVVGYRLAVRIIVRWETAHPTPFLFGNDRNALPAADLSFSNKRFRAFLIVAQQA
jgi:hypothetical protein